MQGDAVWECCLPVVIGDAGQLRHTVALVGARLEVTAASSPSAIPAGTRAVFVVQAAMVPDDPRPGRRSAAGGEAAYQCIVRAVELVEAGESDAICTAPLNKEALHAAGHLYPGHTELLAALTGSDDVAMVLVGPGLRVAHVTTHAGLRKAIDLVRRERVETVIAPGAGLLRRIGIEPPASSCAASRGRR